MPKLPCAQLRLCSILRFICVSSYCDFDSSPKGPSPKVPAHVLYSRNIVKQQPRLSIVWQTGLSGGAPDNVRCARLVSGELATLGKHWRRTTIIHWTVRWCTGLSGEPTVASATIDRQIRERRVAHANGRLGAPDCPVCTRQCPVSQPVRSCNDRLCQEWKEIAHRT
jgi:hypothetical protein